MLNNNYYINFLNYNTQTHGLLYGLLLMFVRVVLWWSNTNWIDFTKKIKIYWKNGLLYFIINSIKNQGYKKKKEIMREMKKDW